MKKFERKSRNPLFNLILQNTTYSVDEQFEEYFSQTSINFTTFDQTWHACFQASDMSGNGGINWLNEGANSGIDDFYNILLDKSEFLHLCTKKNVFGEYLDLTSFINEFITYFLNNVERRIEPRLYSAARKSAERRAEENFSDD